MITLFSIKELLTFLWIFVAWYLFLKTNKGWLQAELYPNFFDRKNGRIQKRTFEFFAKFLSAFKKCTRSNTKSTIWNHKGHPWKANLS